MYSNYKKFAKYMEKWEKIKLRLNNMSLVTHCTDIDLCCMGHWKSTSRKTVFIFFNSLFTKHDPGEMKGKPPWLLNTFRCYHECRRTLNHITAWELATNNLNSVITHLRTESPFLKRCHSMILIQVLLALFLV